MPKYVIHVLVMEKVAERLASSANEEEAELGRIMREHRGLAALGAIGPDLFFWAPDYVVCQVLLEFYDAWDAVKAAYDATIGKVVEAVEAVKDAVEDVMEVVSPGLVEILESVLDEAGETFDQFVALLTRGPLAAALRVENLLTDLADLPDATARIFDLFKPPLQEGKGEEEWYWFDMLHYRETGAFARRLLELARTEEERAYALGYLTHVATDFVGHGYVNQIVGAPYRNDVQRHVVVENFMDAWAFHEYVGGDIATDLVEWLDLPERLPEGVVDMLHRAFQDVYGDLPHPTLINGDLGGFLTREDIRTTYELFLRVTRSLEDSIRKPEEPFSGVMDVLEEMGERFWENLTNPPEPPEVEAGGCSVLDYLSFGATERSRECYESLVENIREWLSWFGEYLVWSLENFKRLLNLIEAALASLAAMQILALLYLLQLTLYGILQKVREVFALNALVYPPVSLVYTSHGRNLITPYQCGSEPGPYPAVWAIRNCLKCPGSEGYETPLTLPSTYSDRDTPRTFIEEVKLDLGALRAYAKAATPEETRRIYLSGSAAKGAAGPPGAGRVSVPRVGSAVELAAWMIRNWDRDPLATVNWNLDSDRGFGYKQWRGRLPPRSPDNLVEGETYDVYG